MYFTFTFAFIIISVSIFICIFLLICLCARDFLDGASWGPKPKSAYYLQHFCASGACACCGPPMVAKNRCRAGASSADASLVHAVVPPWLRKILVARARLVPTRLLCLLWSPHGCEKNLSRDAGDKHANAPKRDQCGIQVGVLTVFGGKTV